MKKNPGLFAVIILMALVPSTELHGLSQSFQDSIYDPGPLKPVDSRLKVKVGETAPDFTLPAVDGGEVCLGQYLGKQNVVLSFVPAAWTPVCSDQ